MSRPASEPHLYSSLSSDPEFGPLVEMFVEEMPDRIAKLLAEMENDDWTELGRVAHQLRGAVGSYGFGQLSEPAGRLEDAVRQDESPAQVYAAVSQLVEMCQRVRAGARR